LYLFVKSIFRDTKNTLTYERKLDKKFFQLAAEAAHHNFKKIN
jgi:hypothetical protein